ncbi:M23 family metallopeptidase [Pseudoflavonifractor sp. 60]|uniref:M23 family metallopeptidase n=1 Tax=Pseudoflavonifractor sp. 60 TaxID=2304576 RepID=UPI001FACE0C5|nr:M23 family metallopeptidase [Pseudoflavonifractor sp. 60]
MKNRSFLNKLGDFAMGKGFYIVLFLCIAAIGISGYYLLQTVMGGMNSTTPVGGDASVTLPDHSVVQPSVPTPSPVQTPETPVTVPEPAVQPDDPEPVKDNTPEPDTQTDTQTQESTQTLSKVFTWPVQGAVLRDFSVETLSLDPTLGDWRTHGGLDIAAAQGVNVLSISAGTVEQIYHDGLMGTTVVVNHGGGLQSWYCNLNEEVAVEVGDSVEIGGVLGTVGSTAIAEVGVDSHIHLETLLEGQPVDPRDYLN